MGRKKKYFTEEERKAARRKNKVKNQSTPKGRAVNLLTSYRQSDKKYGRGECTLTADWIVENIFSQPCHYCGRTDWTKMGCNRIDNSLPHTPDNCVPCCHACNLKLENKWQKQVYQYTLDRELVNVWKSTMECARNGYKQSSVSSCCLGKMKEHKGYLWSYIPL